MDFAFDNLAAIDWKFAVGIFVVLMIFNAIASAMQKANEKQKRHEMQDRISRDRVKRGEVPLPPLPEPQQRQPPPILTANPPPRRRQARKIQQQRPQQQPVAPTQSLASTPVMTSEVAKSQISERPNRAASNAASAASINAWLKPQTLRQQFILTELLQPPLAMRQRDDRL